MDNEAMDRIVSIIDVYTFAIQVLALLNNCTEWDEDPAIAVHQYGQRIVSANRLAKRYGIEPNKTQKREAEEIFANNHIYDLRVYVIPAYPTRKPNQTALREAARKILHQILVQIPKNVIKWDVPPTVEWVPLDEVYFDLTGQIDYIMKRGTYERILWPNGFQAHMLSSFGNNIVGTPDDAVSLQNGPEAYPLNASKNPTTKMFYGCTSKPTKPDDIRRALGMYYTCKIMDHIYNSTGLHCTGGVGPNKMLAKAACSMVKPGTLLFLNPLMLRKLKIARKIPIKKMSVLDSELRQVLKDHEAETLKDVQNMVRSGEIMEFGFTGEEIVEIKQALQGIDSRPVITKHHTKHVNCAKNFVYRPLQTKSALITHLWWLLKEFQQRLKEERKENREPEKMCVVFSYVDDQFTYKPFYELKNLKRLLRFLIKDIDCRRKRITRIKVSGVRLKAKTDFEISVIENLIDDFKTLKIKHCF